MGDILLKPTLDYLLFPPTNQWQYFECGVKLIFARWSALRMAMEGEWGGGHMEMKYMNLLHHVLEQFKYKKNVYFDDLIVQIEDYVEEQFNLLCEDGSIEEVITVILKMADECKTGKFTRVVEMQTLMASAPQGKVDLKMAKVDTEEGILMMMDSKVQQEQNQEQMTSVPVVDADGWETVPVRRSNRSKATPQYYDPQVEFPGAH